MYYELYIDVLFLENLLLDYLLLVLLKKLLKCRASRIRMLLAAAFASAADCVFCVFFPGRSGIGALCIYAVIGTVMVKAGLCIKDRRLLGRAVILLYICGLLLGGIFQWLQSNLNIPLYPFLGFSLVSFWLLSACMSWLMSWKGRAQGILEAVLSFRGNNVSVKALLDTGNHLRDPFFGKPVSIITEELQKSLCDGEEVLFLQIPFHSIGKQHGMMEAFFADSLRIRTAEGSIKLTKRPLIGITKEPLSSKNEYDMILHPDLLE